LQDDGEWDGGEGGAVLEGFLTSLLIYDERCGWSPSLNASKGTGGTEVHLVQVATWLAGRGFDVTAFCHDGQHQVEDGVRYIESRAWDFRSPVDVLLTVRKSTIPTTFRAGRIFTLVTDDPRPEPDAYSHLLNRSTLVCVSEWQAALYRALGHTCVVIPAMIDDATYAIPHNYVPGRFACMSAWNKGTDETLRIWSHMSALMPGKTLVVGCPYSAPADARQRCEDAGAIFVGGELRPGDIVRHLSLAEAHVRVCTIGETFGATDAIAAALGCRVHVYCTGDVGALPETVPGGVWTSRPHWERAIARHEPVVMRDFRVSKIMPQWEALLR
jgi:hypothetical protein